jgi:hypothetical protein
VQHICFNDGTVINYILPFMIIKGIIFGDRIVEQEGTVYFRDPKNMIGAELKFKAFEGGFFSGWFAKKETKPNDYFNGILYDIEPVPSVPETAAPVKRFVQVGEAVGEIYGTWLGFVEFDGKRFWDWRTHEYPGRAVPIDNPLPSDARYREDLLVLASGKVETAGHWKGRLEERQRRDRKLRAAFEKAQKKDSMTVSAAVESFMARETSEERECLAKLAEPGEDALEKRFRSVPSTPAP